MSRACVPVAADPGRRSGGPHGRYPRAARVCYEKLRALEPDDPGHAARLATILFSTDRPPAWQVLRTNRLVSRGGATLSQKPDGSILASGFNPSHDTYEITALTDAVGITALRLEVIPDASLPYSVSGRAPENGNFCLSEWTVTVKPRGADEKPLTIRWKDAWSDHRVSAAQHYANHDMHIGQAIDGDPDTYWEPWPKNSSPHWAIFIPALPIGQAGGSRLTITISSQAYAYHNLGRFRISATTATDLDTLKLVAAPGVPARDPWTRLAAAYSRRGQWQPALATLQHAAALNAELSPAAFLLRGLVHDRLGHRAESVHAIDTAVAELRTDRTTAASPILSAATPSARRAAALAEAERMIERTAEESMGRIDPSEPDIDSFELLARAESSARRLHRSQAIDDLSRVIRINAGYFEVHQYIAMLHLLAGDLAAYRAFRRDVTATAYQSELSPVLAGNAAWLSALGPDPSGDYAHAIALAEKAVSGFVPGELPGRASRLLILSGVLYRAGRYQSALNRMNERMGELAHDGEPIDWILLAMIHHGLGHDDESRRWLARLASSSGPDSDKTGEGYWERLEVELLQSEAVALILYDPVFPPDPFR